MAKPRKKSTAQPAAPEPTPMPLIGDKVTMPRSKSVLEVNHVSRDGNEVDLQLPGTNLQWFRVRTDNRHQQDSAKLLENGQKGCLL